MYFLMLLNIFNTLTKAYSSIDLIGVELLT